jgi:hypothetical protein
MPTDPSAEIIPFPLPAVPDRLSRALSRLEDALLSQQEAVAYWRSRLELLRGSVGRLETSLHRYGDELVALQGAVGRLRHEAERLGS